MSDRTLRSLNLVVPLRPRAGRARGALPVGRLGLRGAHRPDRAGSRGAGPRRRRLGGASSRPGRPGACPTHSAWPSRSSSSALGSWPSSAAGELLLAILLGGRSRPQPVPHVAWGQWGPDAAAASLPASAKPPEIESAVKGSPPPGCAGTRSSGRQRCRRSVSATSMRSPNSPSSQAPHEAVVEELPILDLDVAVRAAISRARGLDVGPQRRTIAHVVGPGRSRPWAGGSFAAVPVSAPSIGSSIPRWPPPAAGTRTGRTSSRARGG